MHSIGLTTSLLYLSKNEIHEIDDMAFDSLIKLKKLFFSENKLSIIKELWFRRLEKLTVLSLSENQIEHIDDNAFDTLVNLKDLYLNNNKLTSVEESWFQNLKVLDR